MADKVTRRGFLGSLFGAVAALIAPKPKEYKFGGTKIFGYTNFPQPPPIFELASLPLPIVHGDFWYSAMRQLPTRSQRKATVLRGRKVTRYEPQAVSTLVPTTDTRDSGGSDNAAAHSQVPRTDGVGPYLRGSDDAGSLSRVG